MTIDSHPSPGMTPEEIIEDSLAKVRAAGYKLTNHRREMIDYFAHDRKYKSAAQVHDHLSQDHPTMSYNTTYRNLYDFCELGILTVTEFNQEQNFRLACINKHHHHHFICTNCGSILPLDTCPMDHMQTDLSQVEVHSHRFEVFGHCADCL